MSHFLTSEISSLSPLRIDDGVLDTGGPNSRQFTRQFLLHMKRTKRGEIVVAACHKNRRANPEIEKKRKHSERFCHGRHFKGKL